MAGFDDLAVKYVLAERHERDGIAKETARTIEDAPNKQAAIRQWVQSIGRWIAPPDGEDEDLVLRSNALEFLASTLRVLGAFVLNSGQVKLLVVFFNSLFGADHRGGITASAQGLRQLVGMMEFTPSLGLDIILSICKLEDDFKRQSPSTRLEVYQLILEILESRKVVKALQTQDETGNFMSSLLPLCQNERDPQNLTAWFATMEIYMQAFKPSDGLSAEVFKSFSSYFPISVRANSTSSEITAESLKVALRTCFASHHRLSKEAIPFLLRKLDQGEATTVTVKVDILNTLTSCLKQYQEPETSIVPYADEIWSSVKYEVRVGDIPDVTIAVIKTLDALVKQLDGEALQPFTSTVWKDLNEDLSNEKYVRQAATLLEAVMGASVSSFGLLAPQTLPHVKKSIRSFTPADPEPLSFGLKPRNDDLGPKPESTSIDSHITHLFSIISRMLGTRTLLQNALMSIGSISPDDKASLSDDIFGDSLFNDLYDPWWRKHCDVGNVESLQKALSGMSSLFQQRSSERTSERLCSKDVCDAIISILAKLLIVFCPTRPFYFLRESELRGSAESAFGFIVFEYSGSFEYLLHQFQLSIRNAVQPEQGIETPNPELRPRDIPSTITQTVMSLSNIIHSGPRSINSEKTWVYSTYLINALLQELHFVLSNNAHPKLWIPLLDGILMVVTTTLIRTPTDETSRVIDRDDFEIFINSTEVSRMPQLDLDQEGEIKGMEILVSSLNPPRRVFCLWVVRQLYRRFTKLEPSLHTPSMRIGLSKDFSSSHGETRDFAVSRHELFLNVLGHVATEVVQRFNTLEQQSLQLDVEAFCLFRSEEIDHMKLTRPTTISRLDDFRPSILTQGIVMGLDSRTLTNNRHTYALDDLCNVLLQTDAKLSAAVRNSLNTLITILANRMDAKDNKWVKDNREKTQLRLVNSALGLFHRDENPNEISNDEALVLFRTLVCYLAGDVRQKLTGSASNPLLDCVFDEGPVDSMMGRQYARALGVIAEQRECLHEMHGAIVKKLSTNWIYHTAVRPRLNLCSVSGTTTPRMATNYSVCVFATIQNFPLTIYDIDLAQIVQIGIHGLTTFKTGFETESLLRVFQTILKNDPGMFNTHLSALITGLVRIYEMARETGIAVSLRPDVEADKYKLALSEEQYADMSSYRAKAKWDPLHPPANTRRMTLEMLRDLVPIFPSTALLPHRLRVMRPLQVAAGDPARDIRPLGQWARRMWMNLSN
ncbi:hypothetical protein F5Y16DRAFT_82165 [Xylariaceae sp. FL0255]|nr:hypothetical protein F5Y16DRAFT_82165 [Xylariaceae sp. FL0255]